MDIGFAKHLKTRQLQLISALAESGQLSIAADVLAMTQPAASRMLAEIEKNVGAKLFERHAKGMRLTLIGDSIAQRAYSMLVELRDLSREVEEFKLGGGGVASVGAVTGSVVGFVIPAIRQLKLISPKIEIHINVGSSDDLFHDLVSGKSDFVLARIPEGVNSSDFDVLPAHNETVKLLVRQSHPLANASSISIAELSQYEWVMQPLSSPVWEAVEATFISARASLPENMINTASLLVIMATVASSDAIAPVAKEVSDLIMGENIGAKFMVLPLEQEIMMSPYYLIQVKGRKLSPVSQRLKNLVMLELEDH